MLARIARSYLFASPLSTAGCYLVRCGAILTFPLNLAVKPAAGVEGGRLRRALMATPYLLLCLAVLARFARRGLSFENLYFPLACTLALLLATTPQLDPRFRVLVLIALLPRTRVPSHRETPVD